MGGEGPEVRGGLEDVWGGCLTRPGRRFCSLLPFPEGAFLKVRLLVAKSLPYGL